MYSFYVRISKIPIKDKLMRKEGTQWLVLVLKTNTTMNSSNAENFMLRYVMIFFQICNN